MGLKARVERKRFLEKAFVHGNRVYANAINLFGANPELSVQEIFNRSLSSAGIGERDLTESQKRILLTDLSRLHKNFSSIKERIKTGEFYPGHIITGLLQHNRVRFLNGRVARILAGAKGIMIMDKKFSSKLDPFGLTFVVDDLTFRDLGRFSESIQRDFDGISDTGAVTFSCKLPSGEQVPISLIPESLAHEEFIEKHERRHREDYLIAQEHHRQPNEKDEAEGILRKEIIAEIGAPSNGKSHSLLGLQSKFTKMVREGIISPKEFAYYSSLFPTIGSAMQFIDSESLIALIRKTPMIDLKRKIERLAEIQKKLRL